MEATGAEALVISSPTFTHESLIREAVGHSMAIFTEKPVDETADKIEELFNIAKSVPLCCSFQRRFDPSYVACTEAVHDQCIGSPISANIFFADHPLPPREFLLTGGNIFMDLAAHDVDYIVNAIQDDVESVYALGTSSDAELREAGVHDNATMVLQFHRGATATIFLSRGAVYGYDQRCEIFGTSGHVAVQNVQETTLQLSDASGVKTSRLQHSFPQRFHTAFGLEIDAFADVILDGRPWPVTKSQCINVQRVTDAAAASVERGTVVKVKTFYDQEAGLMEDRVSS